MDYRKYQANSNGLLWELAKEYTLQRSIDRVYYITLAMSVLFFAYGFLSINFIKVFWPHVTLYQNLWPRMLLNTIPLLALAVFIKKSKRDNKTKLFTWVLCFTLVFDAACVVYVWPIAWAGNSNIMLFVNAVNNSIFLAIGMILGLPLVEAVYSISIIGLLLWVPLFLTAYKAGNIIIFETILNDTLFLGVSGFLFGLGFNHAERRLALLEIEREREASKFLNPIVSKAIFGGDGKLLNRRVTSGFIISIDIRNSTVHLQKYERLWLQFRKEYFALIAKSVIKHRGNIQKTMGDGHLINFGIIEHRADLMDVPGLRVEEQRAQERRLQYFSDRAFQCLEEIFNSFQVLAKKHFPNDTVRIGAGIDQGHVEAGIDGDRDSSALEFDVNGDAVNCSMRLQEYSKEIQSLFDPTASLLVVSPFASDFIRDFSKYKKVMTTGKSVRNYEQIRCVLVREFIYNAQTLPFKKAA